MAQWRKVLVSGSAADVSSLNVGTAEGTAGTIINNSSIAGSRITGSFTGSFVGDGTNLTGITATSLDIDAFGSDLTSATLEASDLFIVSDGGTDGRANIGDLAAPLAGTGLEANSNTIRIAAAAAGNGLSGGAGSALAVDLNELSAATVNVAADSIAIIDADDNSSKKESIADFVDGINGTGIDAGSGQLSISAAQTNITSVINSSLGKIGTAADQEYIKFDTANEVNVHINNNEKLSVTATGVDITGDLTLAGAVSASSGMTGSFTGSFVGDGSNLTGVGFQIDELSNTLTAVAQSDLLVVADADASNEEKKITFSNFEDQIFGNVSGDATIAAAGALTIADNAVSLAKMAGLARGNIIIGDSSGDPSALDASTDGRILVGDGNDLASVAVSGDVALASNGAVTIQANAVEGSMLNSNTAGTGLTYAGSNLDVASAQTTIETIYNTSLIIGRAANDTTINFTTDDEIVFDQGSTEAMKIDSTGVTVAGNLTVNGSTTTISSTNLLVEDAFIFAGSGSAGSNVDGGLIVQEGSNEGTGSALYHDTTDNRWSVAKTVDQKATAVTALEHVVTVKLLGDNDAAIEGDKEYGVGEMAINNDGTIWIYS